jgi:PAS domain S-box-containing protein
MESESRTILLVEDEALIALEETRQLQQAGYRVVHSFTGEKAIEIVEGNPGGIDLVLMDIDLGKGIDGTEAAQRILGANDIPILFLSSRMEPGIVRKTEEITNYGYVVKSSVFTVLDASIKMAFKLFASKRQLDLGSLEIESANEELRASLERSLKINDRLILSEDKFSKAFHLNPDAININRLSDGVYLDINEGFTRIMGFTREDAIGRSSLPGDLGIWVHQGDRDRLLRDLREKGEAANLEADFRKKDGSITVGLMSARIIEIAGESCIISITRDMGNWKTLERSLRETEAKFKLAFENSPIGIALTSIDGRLRMVNRAFCGMLGRTMEEMAEAEPMGLLHPEDRGIGREMSRTLIEGGMAICRARQRYIHRDGRAVWADVSVSLVKDSDGRPEFFISHVVDITEGKSVEDVLKSTLDSQQDIYILSIDRDFKCLYANRAYQRLKIESLGIGTEVGMRLSDNLPGDKFLEASHSYYERALRGESLRVVERYDFADMVIESAYNPIYDDSGLSIGATSFSTDITGRVRTESALKKSEEKWRSIVAASPDGIAEVSQDGKIVFASPKCLDLLGYDSMEEVAGQCMERFVDGEDLGKARSYLQSLYSGKERRSAELRLRRKDGSVLCTEINPDIAEGLEDRAKSLILVIRDIGERKEREGELKESHDRYRSLLNAIGEGFCYTDADEVFRMANPSCDRIFGVGPNTLVGRSMRDFLDEEGRAIMEKGIEIRKSGKPSDYVAPVLRPDGQRRWLRINSSPVGDHEGRYIGSSVVLADITEELKAKEALNRLVENKELLMKELEHRVKNSLSIASSLIGIAMGEIADQKALGILKDTDSRMRSISSVYERLYLSGSVQSIDFGTYLGGLARSVIDSYYRTATKIRLDVRAERVEVDTKRAISLGLIANELLTNSVKHAFPNASTGTIAVVLEEIGDRVKLCVSDDGVGLGPNGAFEKSASMGMMLIRELVKQIGGTLEIVSSDGMTVTICFESAKAASGS